MKTTICITALLLFSFSNIFGQKIKYKKGSISVDKVKKFEVVKTKKGGILGVNNFSFNTIDGTQILAIGDTTVFLEKLPHETQSQPNFTGYIISAPALGKTEIVPLIAAFNFGKKLSKDLDKLGFFKSGLMSDDIFQAYIEMHKADKAIEAMAAIDSINIKRQFNNKLTVEMFGPISERTPSTVAVKDGKIVNGLSTIGQFKLDKKGSYATTYKIVNNKKDVIGKFTIIPSDNKANIRLFVHNDDNAFRKLFTHKLGTTNDQKFIEAANYLIKYGYL